MDEEELAISPEDRVLMTDDRLFYGTAETGPLGDSDVPRSEILSTTENGELPTENGQSNFGCVGNLYTTANDEDTIIMVHIGEERYVFYDEKQE